MPLAGDQHVVQALMAQRSLNGLANKFARRDRTGAQLPMPFPGETPSNALVNLLSQSRSRIRNLNRLRLARVRQEIAHLPRSPGSGRMVLLARLCTVRVGSFIMNSTYTRWSSTVSTCRKSQAGMPDAWAARNCRHDLRRPSRRGAEPGIQRCQGHVNARH
jgi:hypothetical protein